MGGVLNIYDGNVYLSFGSSPKFKTGNFCTPEGFPTGGIYQLAGPLVRNRYDSNAVIFDRKTDRKSVFPNYKSGRSRNPKVIPQSNALEYYVAKCGTKVFFCDGYEADDLIDEVVRQNYADYDRIRIFTVDMDLARNIDPSGKVELLSPTSTSHNVDISNYSYTVIAGSTIPYGSVIPHKMFFGDKSDKIPAISSISPQACWDRFWSLLNGKIKNPQAYSNINTMEYFVLNCKYPAEVITELRLRMKLFYSKVDYDELEFKRGRGPEPKKFNFKVDLVPVDNDAMMTFLKTFKLAKLYKTLYGEGDLKLNSNEYKAYKIFLDNFKSGIDIIDAGGDFEANNLPTPNMNLVEEVRERKNLFEKVELTALDKIALGESTSEEDTK